jgi:hypothetical protein
MVGWWKVEKKVVDEKDLIAFLCKLNSILIASTTMSKERERVRRKRQKRSLPWKKLFTLKLFILVLSHFYFSS